MTALPRHVPLAIAVVLVAVAVNQTPALASVAQARPSLRLDGGAVGAIASAQPSLRAVRTLVRVGLYPVLLVFAGGAMLRAVLGGRHRGAWLLPAPLRAKLDPGEATELARRERALILDAGLVAIMLAAAAALLDARAAGGSFSPGAAHGFLVSTSAGLIRLWLVGLLAIAWLGAVVAPRPAAGAAAVALGALVLEGHRGSAPALFVLDWVRVLADAVLLGGITTAVWLWAPGASGGAVPRPLTTAVMTRAARLGLPVLLVAALTAVISAAVELKHLSSLWSSEYGLGLLVEVVLLGVLAAISYRRAARARVRPANAELQSNRLLAPRSWAVARPPSLAGVGLAAAVGLLIFFPLPRELAAPSALASPARASCSPCPLPFPASDELAVATNAGSDIVAAWLRPHAGRLDVELRVLDSRGAPAAVGVELDDASRSVPCGPGCTRFSVAPDVRQMRVLVHLGAGAVLATLSSRWQADGNAAARRVLDRAQSTMRKLASVREIESATSSPGLYALTDTRLQAPDRVVSTSYVVRPPHPPVLEGQSVQIGAHAWLDAPGTGWQLQPADGRLPFRTASWFAWTRDAEAARLISITSADGRRVATVALMDPGTPAWWTLKIDLRDYHVLFARLITAGESATYRYSEFDRAAPISAPRGARP